jgi:glycosyltransferase involved in cell wall biosynthesis
VRIVIDLQGVQNESRYRGIGRYSLAFVKALVKALIDRRAQHEVIVLLSDLFPDTIAPVKAALGEQLAGCTVRVWSGIGPTDERKPQNRWRQQVSELLREAFIAQLDADVVIATSVVDSPGDNTVVSIGQLTRTYTVAILYDLIPLLYTSEYLTDPVTLDWYYERLHQLRRADYWLAISESSRRDGIEQLGLPPTSVTNISAAIGEETVPQQLSEIEAAAIRAKLSITRPFLLYTGAFDPRKNIERLLAAYAALPPAIRNTHQLVLAGGMNRPQHALLDQQIIAAGLAGDHVIVTGRVSDTDFSALYGLCRAHILPTYCEGFGLTALEAMACGAVVIGSNYSSVPEVIGNPEALFDPFSVTAIAQKIEQALTDEAFRARLLTHSREKLKQFSWDQTAQRALAVLEQLEIQQAFAPRRAAARALDLRRILPQRIAALPQTPERTDLELREVAALVAAVVPREDPRPVLFVDITELHRHDSHSGIQRVVRSVLHQLFKSVDAAGGSGYKLQLVYATDRYGYKAAQAFTARWLGQQATPQADGAGDDWINPRQGDVFLGLDLNFNIDDAHQTYFADLRHRGVGVYFVVYDLLPVLFKETFVPELVRRYAFWLSVVAQQDGVICISQAVAAELRTWLQVNAPASLHTLNIDWFALGADIASSVPTKGLPENGQAILAQLAAAPTFLAVGTLEPRKRQAQILEAFELLWAQGSHAQLVLVGKQGWLTEELAARLRQHPQQGQQLFWFENASDEFLEQLYASATCLIAASEAEGFGLPIVEAARHGLPVIARDIPVFREVAQTHAYFYAGGSAAALAEAVQAWLVLFADGRAPDSSQIHRTSWVESTRQLLSHVFRADLR